MPRMFAMLRSNPSRQVPQRCPARRPEESRGASAGWRAHHIGRGPGPRKRPTGKLSPCTQESLLPTASNESKPERQAKEAHPQPTCAGRLRRAPCVTSLPGAREHTLGQRIGPGGGAPSADEARGGGHRMFRGGANFVCGEGVACLAHPLMTGVHTSCGGTGQGRPL